MDPAIMADDRSELRSMFAIDAPAHVENLARFFKCCGGLGQIEQTFRDEPERLQFRFRADDPNSVPLFSERRSAADLVVRVRVRRGGTDNREPIYHWEPYGVVDTLFHFDHTICDMQLLPTASDIRNELIKSDFILNCNPDLTLDGDQSHTLIKQYFYSRYTQPKSVFHMMQKEEAKEMQTDLIRRVRKSRKAQAVVLRWNVERVPSQIPDELQQNEQMQPIDEDLKVKVEEQFRQQPIWLRKALLVKLQCSPLSLRFILPLYAYLFENGPFRNLWIRYGYDPRQDPSSKCFQMIDIRHLEANASQFRKSAMFHDRNYRAQGQLEPSTSAETADHQSYRFGPGNPASLRSCPFQLCYIDSDQVQQIVHENDGRETGFTERDGWLTQGALDRIRTIMHEIVKPMLMAAAEPGTSTDADRGAAIYPDDDDYEDIEVSEVFEPLESFNQD